MATIAFSAMGMALGGSIGGSVMGLSMATIGRAAGAVIGQRIDQRLLGAGSEAVEVGKMDRMRLNGVFEGTDIPLVFGRMRVAGQIIWASRFREEKTTTGGGGKGAPPAPKTTTYAYSISLALALCEGEISHIGRIWADGRELVTGDLDIRVYKGDDTQMPDPLITAIEGDAFVPAYRGTAYVVIENLPLDQFGNRVPQLNFEVFRGAQNATDDLPKIIKGAALVPGSGEYALATSKVRMDEGFGRKRGVNTNARSGQSDLLTSLDQLQNGLPACKSLLLVVSWFGDDLRCGSCQIKPMVEQKTVDAEAMPWKVSGLTRASADALPLVDGKPIYGGTPADAAVVEALTDMRDRGLSAVFYPFVLMTQLAGNGLPDPLDGASEQPALPWRGRISSGGHGTNDAITDVAGFMGTATASDFTVSGTKVTFQGTAADEGYRRFILHYAHLCKAAGGVDAFCIGSELRGLTWLQDGQGNFPMVDALIALAADVRAILGSGCKISYAADWSEYHGVQPVGTADKIFHLDPLWADPNINFIGIDNYMPLSDWRDGADHLDQDADSIYALDYLSANVAGGEGYDWFYHSPEARAAQIRTPITDAAGEPWVWRYKDLAGWWSNPHHNRIGGARAAAPTAWVPQSKPIWFTEYGCAAIDKGTNQPNKFIDPKSSESALPYHSHGGRDELIQMQYYRAFAAHYANPAHNPISSVYGEPMLDTNRMHAWAWDARPFPQFPMRTGLWSDGGNYSQGHWLNGRDSNRHLADVVAEICQRAGVTDIDTSALHGVVRGYVVQNASSMRAALQPLMTAFGFDVIGRDGKLIFKSRDTRVTQHLSAEMLALNTETDSDITYSRAAAPEIEGRVQLAFVEPLGDYSPATAQAIRVGEENAPVSQNDVPLLLTRAEGRGITTRWLHEADAAMEQAKFALPPSQSHLGAGDIVTIDQITFRIDRVEDHGLRLIEATRVSSEAYVAENAPDEVTSDTPFLQSGPVELLLLDLPLLTGDEQPHAPYAACVADPWAGPVALYDAPQDSSYGLRTVFEQPAVVGITQTALGKGPVGIWDRQAAVEVELVAGELQSQPVEAVLAGGNLFAIGDGSVDNWELFQCQTATLIAAGRYRLSGFLRGQAGTAGLMPDVWPAGSFVVAMDGVPQQLDLPSATRGTERFMRFGPADLPYTDETFRARAKTFAGVGLRPYPVVHLRQGQTESGPTFDWIRATRIDGDQWGQGDVPLAEADERYQIEVWQNGALVRQIITTQPQWHYPDAERLAEVGALPFTLRVAQISDRFGPGLAAELDVLP